MKIGTNTIYNTETTILIHFVLKKTHTFCIPFIGQNSRRYIFKFSVQFLFFKGLFLNFPLLFIFLLCKFV